MSNIKKLEVPYKHDLLEAVGGIPFPTTPQIICKRVEHHSTDNWTHTEPLASLLFWQSHGVRREAEGSRTPQKHLQYSGASGIVVAEETACATALQIWCSVSAVWLNYTISWLLDPNVVWDTLNECKYLFVSFCNGVRAWGAGPMDARMMEYMVTWISGTSLESSDSFTCVNFLILMFAQKRSTLTKKTNKKKKHCLTGKLHFFLVSRILHHAVL